MGKVLKRSLSFLLALTIGFSSALVGLGEVDFDKYDLSRVFAIKTQAASESDLTFVLNNSGKSYSVAYCNEYASGSLTIPSTYNGKPVTQIGRSAFLKCANLTSIIIPNSVTSIGSSAFKDCDSLTSITIPDSVTSIDSAAFKGTGYYNDNSNWENGVLYIGNCLIKVRTALSGECVIKVNTRTIAGSAFSGCERLIAITIPDSVISIGDYAFSNCDKLTSITIPDSVISIGGGAFFECVGLVSAKIGNCVTNIGDYAFYNCTSLASITIPDKVTSIGSSVFYNCTSLISTKIPDNVTSIGDHAFFSCTSLASIAIPDSVTSIDDYAFYNCTSLTSVTIPDSVTSIGQYGFYGCKNLKSVALGNGITVIGGFAFYGCTSLTSITIPDSVTRINLNAFSCCTSLTSVTIGNSVKTIGNYAFSGCKSLTSITIPDSVTSMGENVFGSCDSLESLYITDLASWCGIGFYGCNSNPLVYVEKVYINGELTTDIVIPDSVTSIGDYTFYCCKSLTTITIPDSVTSIGQCAFYNCNNLKYVFYTGSEIDWGNMVKGTGNTPLTDVAIHYNSTEHKYQDVDFVPTCTESGGKGKRCVICGFVSIYEFLTATGHQTTEWITGKNPTCTETGSKDEMCLDCFEIIKTEPIPAIGHTAVTDKAVAPTCENTGLTEGSHCSVCNEVLTAQTVVAATGHTVVIDEAIASTCENTGLTEGSHCSVCDKILVAQTTIPATGHTAVTDKAVAPTCTKAGKTAGSHCSVCNAVIKAQTTIAAKGHTYKTVTTKAALTKNGKVETKCTVCGKVSKTTVIYYPKTIKLSTTSYTYNGKVKTPSVTVKDSNGKALVKGTDYKVTVPSGRKLPGVYTYTITFMGKYSGTKTLTFKILPATVNASKMTAAATTSSIRINWPKVEGATGYKVYQYSSSQGKYVQIATVTGNTYNKTGLKAGTTYQFKVKAYKKLSNGTVIEGAASSAYATATKCAAPKISRLVASSGQKTTLKWSAVTGATGYQVYYSTNNSDYKKAVSTTSKTASKTFSKSTKGKKIYFKVRAYKKVNGQTIYGNWSAVKSVVIK